MQIIIIHFFNLAENDRTYQSPIGEFLGVNFQVFQVKRTGWEAERTRLNFLTEFTWLPSSEHLRIAKVASFTFWLNFDSDCVTYLSLWRKTQGGCFGAYCLKMHKLCYFFASWIVYLISVTSVGLLYLWCFHSAHRTHRWQMQMLQPWLMLIKFYSSHTQPYTVWHIAVVVKCSSSLSVS